MAVNERGIQPNSNEEAEEVDSYSSLTYDERFHDEDDGHLDCDNGRSDVRDATDGTEDREDCDDYEVLEVKIERDMHG